MKGRFWPNSVGHDQQNVIAQALQDGQEHPSISLGNSATSAIPQVTAWLTDFYPAAAKTPAAP